MVITQISQYREQRSEGGSRGAVNMFKEMSMREESCHMLLNNCAGKKITNMLITQISQYREQRSEEESRDSVILFKEV